jgi:hypothetical protein
MSGYADDFSKSNNAHTAEAGGRFPASVLAAKFGVKTGAIRALCHSCEWHHTSKFYNGVDYYDEESAMENIDALRTWREPKPDVFILENCSGVYLEWHGTRNHPHATEIEFENVRVTQKGKWFTLELGFGQGDVRKGKDTRGFQLYDGNKKILTYNA